MTSVFATGAVSTTLGLVSPVLSSPHPLHDPASTSRIASARPNRRRARLSTSWSRRTTSLVVGDRGSVAKPNLKDLGERAHVTGVGTRVAALEAWSACR